MESQGIKSEGFEMLFLGYTKASERMWFVSQKSV